MDGRWGAVSFFGDTPTGFRGDGGLNWLIFRGKSSARHGLRVTE